MGRGWPKIEDNLLTTPNYKSVDGTKAKSLFIIITGDSRKPGCNPIFTEDRKIKIDCGSLLDFYTEGTECQLNCEIGYVIEGSSACVCVNGSWSDTDASCKGILILLYFIRFLLPYFIRFYT